MLIDQAQFLKSEMRKLERSRYAVCNSFKYAVCNSFKYTACNLFERIPLCALCMHLPYYIYLCKHVLFPHFP